MKFASSIGVGVALLVGFVLGSSFGSPKAQARAQFSAHIEEVLSVPTGRQTNGSIQGFSCVRDEQGPRCFALVLSGN